MTYEMDVDQTMDAMAYAATVDLSAGMVTVFAVFCAGDEEQHFSHGGTIVLDANEAITAAMEANAMNPNCHYLAGAMGMHPADMVQALRMMAYGPEGGDE